MKAIKNAINCVRACALVGVRAYEPFVENGLCETNRLSCLNCHSPITENVPFCVVLANLFASVCASAIVFCGCAW